MENLVRTSAPRAVAGDTQRGVKFAVVVHVQVSDESLKNWDLRTTTDFIRAAIIVQQFTGAIS